MYIVCPFPLYVSPGLTDICSIQNGSSTGRAFISTIFIEVTSFDDADAMPFDIIKGQKLCYYVRLFKSNRRKGRFVYFSLTLDPIELIPKEVETKNH